jgi:hypothetical protein
MLPFEKGSSSLALRQKYHRIEQLEIAAVFLWRGTGKKTERNLKLSCFYL